MNRTDLKQKNFILFFEANFCEKKIEISGPLKKIFLT